MFMFMFMSVWQIPYSHWADDHEYCSRSSAFLETLHTFSTNIYFYDGVHMRHWCVRGLADAVSIREGPHVDLLF